MVSRRKQTMMGVFSKATGKGTVAGTDMITDGTGIGTSIVSATNGIATDIS
jgi:hypothetical protein